MRILTVTCLYFSTGNLFSQEVKILPPVTVTSSSNVSQKVDISYRDLTELFYIVNHRSSFIIIHGWRAQVYAFAVQVALSGYDEKFC